MVSMWQRRFGPYREILRAIWANRDRPRYAWRILNDGVCDGCALGTSGMRDWTMDGIHLCWVRLNLLRLNTMPAFDPRILERLDGVESLSERELRGLGRLPVPLLRRRGEPGFTPLSWEEALDLVGARLAAADPERLGFYLVSRGTVNETYFAAQKAVRALGTNHIDNSARICHSPSTTGLKETVGFGATTVSYRDMLGSDLVVFLGSDVANNQPVMMKYLHLARKEGTRVAVVNPYREPGLERYWVPSSFDSAVKGTPVADRFFTVRVGGDVAFLNGVLKHLIENGWTDEAFLRDHTAGWDALCRTLAGQDFADLEQSAGTSREEMLAFAQLYAGARTAIFVWSMGITMHRHGVDNVRAIVNTALARGMVGRPGCGLMPIRGHSGVQGGAEMGAVPGLFPGGRTVGPETAREMEALWGFPVPDTKGRTVTEMVRAAERGELDVMYTVGSNLLGVLPDPDAVREALARVPLRVHHDVVLNPQMFVDPGEEVLLLPATTRYEMAGGNTETSTERRVIFNPEIPGPRVPEARDEWRVLYDVVRRARPERASALSATTTAELRAEIARAAPLYEGIQHLAKKGDQFQWGGVRLGEGGRFGLPDGRARFTPLVPPVREIPDGKFQLTTRRGKQFNSMVFGERDMLAGGGRRSVLLAEEDCRRLGLSGGDPVLIRSERGSFRGTVEPASLRPGTVMMYWPEANVLIDGDGVEPRSGMPPYRDAVVDVLPLGAEAAGSGGR